MDQSTAARVWVLGEPHAGMRNQALGLAEALGWPYAVRDIHPAGPRLALPVGRWPLPLGALPPAERRQFTPPWPKLLISSGRRSVPYALWLKRHAGNALFTAHINRPYTAPSRFDLIVTPSFDQLKGSNVIATTGALHRLTPAGLDEARNTFAPSFANLPLPRIAVLIGGSNRYYQVTEGWISDLAISLNRLSEKTGGSLLISTSRRTGDAHVSQLRAELTAQNVHFYSGGPDNPYFGYLAVADHLVVSADSVSMLTEALATGSPVHLLNPPNRWHWRTSKFAHFHKQLQKQGYIRKFTDTLGAATPVLTPWTYEPLLETTRVAAEIRRRIGTW